MGEIDISIPDFLKVGKDGKNVKPGPLKGKAKKVTQDQGPTEPTVDERILKVKENMTTEQRAYFEMEEAAGLFMRSWYLDPSTVAMKWAVREQKEEAKREKLAALKELAAQKKAAAPPKLVKPEFGVGTIITWVKEPNPRRPNTRAHTVYGEMITWWKANGGDVITKLFAATKYDKTDFLSDLNCGNIKSNIAPTAPRTPRPPAAPKAADSEKKPRKGKIALPPARAPDAAVWSGGPKKKALPPPRPVDPKAEARKAAKAATKEFKKAVKDARGNKERAAKKLKKAAVKVAKKSKTHI